MRRISANGCAQVARRYGNESITIIEVDWVQGITKSYADRDVQTIPGKILEVSDLDNVIDVNANNNSQQLSLTLDDTDGSIKAIFDTHDIHKRTVRVYQWFEGLALTDKFLVFSGKINTPVSWSEKDRTVKLTVVSQLEDGEIGFSAEEGQFPYLPADMVGKAWPMIFGTVQDCPALQVNKAVEATALTGVGIITGQAEQMELAIYENGTNSDSGQGESIAQMAIQMSAVMEAATCWHGVDDERAASLLDQYNQMAQQLAQEAAQKAKQEECTRRTRKQQIEEANAKGNGENPIRTVGGEDFPQNTPIWININGGSFYGQFKGNLFYVSDRIHRENEESVKDDAASRSTDSCPTESKTTKYDLKQDVPCGCGDFFNRCQLHHYGYIISTATSSSSTSTESVMQQFWADAGSRIVMESDEPLTYIVSIIPGTVLAVKAFKEFEGPKVLALVPNDLYTVQTVQYGTITAVQIVLKRPLSTITTNGVSQGWSDDIYVTFQSSIGPDIIDILTYVIENYTDLDWDHESFEYVRQKLAPFPANFPLLERKNTLEVLKDIAFQCRCAIWLDDGVFYLKYLPEEPEADSTITVSDMDADRGIEVELTRTEDLVTKMKVKWRVSHAPDNDYTRENDRNERWMILRHNIARYGTQEKEYDWYIFNQPDIILKCATFWLIRLSNTWKRITFRTFLNKLNLETFDTILFSSVGYVASAPVKAVVEKANYNSADNCIEFQCLVPVRAGEKTPYKYFWPSKLSVNHTWPPAEDIASGDAGGGKIGSGASGNLPIGFTDGIGQGGTVFVGGTNVVFRPHSDRGDSTPTDVGFAAQPVTITSQYAELVPSAKPRLNLKPKFLRNRAPLRVPALEQGQVIDLARTKVTDSSQGDTKYGYLGSLLSLGDNEEIGLNIDQAQVMDAEGNSDYLSNVVVMKDGVLMINGEASIVTQETPDGAPFDYRLDENKGKLGAGTAFLQD